jgi:hypothetical protein
MKSYDSLRVISLASMLSAGGCAGTNDVPRDTGATAVTEDLDADVAQDGSGPGPDGSDDEDASVDEQISSGSCRSQADCRSQTTCRPPDYQPPICLGIACPSDTRLRCKTDIDCGDGPDVMCQVKNDETCGPLLYSVCSGLCANNDDCGGTECQPDGRCLPGTHCSIGGSCPPHTECSASTENDPFGCTRRSCKADRDCGMGTCVNLHCYGTMGNCWVPDETCLAP